MLDPFYPVVPDSNWVLKLVPVGTKLIQLRIKDQPEAEVRRQGPKAPAAQRSVPGRNDRRHHAVPGRSVGDAHKFRASRVGNHIVEGVNA